MHWEWSTQQHQYSGPFEDYGEPYSHVVMDYCFSLVYYIAACYVTAHVFIYLHTCGVNILTVAFVPLCIWCRSSLHFTEPH